MKQAVRDLRRKNLRRLLADYRSQRQFCDGVGLVQGHVSQMVNGTREMGEEVARRIERALGLAPGWMDADPEGGEAPPPDEVALGQLPADQLKLLADYRRLTPRHQEMVRETAAGYLVLNHQQPQEPT